MSSLFMPEEQLDIELNRLKNLVEVGKITQQVADTATVNLLSTPVAPKTAPLVQDASGIEAFFRREGEERLYPWKA